MKIEAELSLYPLRTDSLDDAVNRFIQELSSSGIKVSPDEMSTRITGEGEDVFRAVSRGFLKAGESDDVVLVAKFSNACPSRDISVHRKEGETDMTVHVDTTRCTGCGICAEACPLKAIRIEQAAVIDDSICDGCGACVEACPNRALSLGGDRPSASLSKPPVTRIHPVPAPGAGPTAGGSRPAARSDTAAAGRPGFLSRILNYFAEQPGSRPFSGSDGSSTGGRGRGRGSRPGSGRGRIPGGGRGMGRGGSGGGGRGRRRG